MTTRTLRLRCSRLPSGLASYPRVVLTSRPDLVTLADPPEIEVRVDGVRIEPVQVARYATVCGFKTPDLSDGYVPVTYPHVLAMPLHLRIMGNAAFPLRPMGLIHLSNSIAMPGELRTGRALSLTVRACNYRKTDAGLAFDMETDISDGERSCWRETCVFMSRWPADALQRSGARPPRPPKAPRDSDVLKELDVTQQTAWSYARVSGDFNPIHLNQRAARFFGLRGAISHGMWSLARSLAEQAAGAPSPTARLETQFLTPVQLPARVAIKRWLEQGVEKRAMCDVRTGRVHMYAHWAEPILT